MSANKTEQKNDTFLNVLRGGGLLLLLWYFNSGSSDTETRPAPVSKATIPALDESLAAQTKLPSEYRTLCEHVAIELKADPGDFHNDKALSEVIAEGHTSVMALRSIRSEDEDIAYVTTHAQQAFADALSRLERINAMPQPQDAGSVMVESFIHGLYGNAYYGYAIGVEADEKRKAIADEVQALMASVDKADAAQMMLPTIAKKYAATPTQNGGRVVVDIDASWGCFGPDDWLCLYNAGQQSLDDCTIQVSLAGKSGGARRNVHFVQHWPARTWVYARYEPGQDIAGRTDAGKSTVSEIQNADISIWSPMYSTQISYAYQGAEKDKDIARLCEDLKFSGSYQSHADGVLWDTQPGLKATLDGVASIPQCRVDVTFRNRSTSKSWYWEHEYWERGVEMSFTTTKDKLNFVPSHIDMVISFPDTSYRYETTLIVD